MIKLVCNEWGKKKLLVSDEKNPQIRGISGSIFFRPDRFEIEVGSVPKDRKRFYLDEIFKGKIRALDYRGKKIPGYAGAVGFKPIADADMPAELRFGRENQGEIEFQMSAVTELPFQVEVYDIGFPQAKGKSRVINLIPARIKTELIALKEDEAVLSIKIVDNQGNVVREDNSTLFTVYLTESNPDGSAFLIGPREVKAKDGTVNLSVVDTQNETVTISVLSEHFLEAEPLAVVF